MIYQAAQDGLIVASAQCTAGWDSLTITAGTTTPPVDIWARSSLTGSGSTTSPSVTLPVRRGEFWRVTHNCGSAYLILFTPFT